MLKKTVVIVGAVVFIASLLSPANAAWKNITKYDGVGSGSGWYGAQEDQEVEPNCVATQQWDLEAFYFDVATSKLNLTGGYNFKDGYEGWYSGDIFIDVTGDAGNPGGYVQPGNGNFQVTNRFGYEYVVRLNKKADNKTLSGTYDVIDLTTGNPAKVMTAYYKQNENSNPWTYVSGGTYKTSGTIVYQSGLSNAVATLEGTTLQGGNNHYSISGIDLSFLGGKTFTAHYTMGCGNDNLRGSATVNVPEPSSVSLLILGVVLLGGLVYVNRKKKVTA